MPIPCLRFRGCRLSADAQTSGVLMKRVGRKGWIAASTSVVLVAIGLAGVHQAFADITSFPAACPWMNTQLTADQRARVLLDHSTLDQKIRWLDEIAANNPRQTAIPVRDPANPFSTTTVTMPAQVPCTPTIAYADGPGSVNAGGGTTTFPVPVAVAATWDTALATQKGAAQADEAWRKDRNVLLAPGLQSGRDPRDGRTSEFLSEDALLGGLMAAAGSKGISGKPGEPVESVIKHYVGYEQELDRRGTSSNMDARTLREIYTRPFEIAIDRGDIGGVMCSYNQVNHVQACSNDTTLNQILKTEIGFDGFVMTDFFAKHSLGATPPDLKAGLDQELNAWLFWSPDQLHQALGSGIISESDIDQAAFRVVRSHIAAGLFDTPMPAVAESDVTTPAHLAVAQQVAQEGSVLLKNQDILPLTGNSKSIAVIGPTASNTVTNGVSAGTVCSYGGGRGCAPIAPVDSIRDRAAADGATVTFDNGSDPTAAAKAAQNADVAVVFGYYVEGEGSDRTNLHLDGNGDALISAVAAANSNTVVVLQTGGPVVMPWLSSVKGVLETWYAGQQMGPAIASLLFGDSSPSGKLPYTFPVSEADLPTAGSAQQYPGTCSGCTGSPQPGFYPPQTRQVEYTEGLEVGYRWYAAQQIRPLFPFGYGLSYSSFAYSKLQVTPVVTDGANEVRIRFRLTNTGNRQATETAQAYVNLPAAANEPSKRLVGWQRVTLGPGAWQDVEITLSRADLRDLHLLQYWNADTGQWTTAQGRYEVSVGGSFDSALADDFTVNR
jgi:beta-glucosidase